MDKNMVDCKSKSETETCRGESLLIYTGRDCAGLKKRLTTGSQWDKRAKQGQGAVIRGTRNKLYRDLSLPNAVLACSGWSAVIFLYHMSMFSRKALYVMESNGDLQVSYKGKIQLQPL